MKVFFIILLHIVLFGCSSYGYKTAKHNGLLYNFPELCEKYKYLNSNPNRLHCIHDGELTGVKLYPASQSEISIYLEEKESNAQAWREASESIKNMGDEMRRNAPKTTYTNCYNSFSGGVNCNSTTY